MGLLTFIKDAGEKLFSSSSAPAQAATPAPDVNALNQTAANAILTYIRTQQLPTEGLNLSFDAPPPPSP